MLLLDCSRIQQLNLEKRQRIQLLNQIEIKIFNLKIVAKKRLPLNKGAISPKTLIGDKRENCPIETSRKKSGMPSMIKSIKQGMRNASPPQPYTKKGKLKKNIRLYIK